MKDFDPIRSMADMRHEFGEHGGVNMSIEASTTFTVMDWPLVVGGKPMMSIPAFVVIAFELTILFGALSTVIGLFILARIPKFQPHVVYDPEFSSGRFGLYVEPPEGKEAEVRRILEAEHPVELRDGSGVANA